MFVREIQIKTIVRYYFTPFRLAIFFFLMENKMCRQGYIGNFVHCWQECKTVQPLARPLWQVFKKLKIELPYDPAISLLGIYPKKLKEGSQGDICTLMFTATLSTIAKRWKQSKYLPTDEWIKKIWDIHTVEYYSALK